MVGMLLSYALNQAIEQRKNLKEYLRVFHVYNGFDYQKSDKETDTEKGTLTESRWPLSLLEKPSNELISFEYHNVSEGEASNWSTSKSCKCEVNTKCEAFKAYFPDPEEFKKAETKEQLKPTTKTGVFGSLQQWIMEKEIKKGIVQTGCFPDKKAFKENWKNIHDAAVQLMSLVDRFMLLEEEADEKLSVDYDQYDDYGIISMLTLYRSNKLMLLYVLVFLVLNPKTDNRKLFENFEDDEKLYTFLMDVQVEDFVALVPVIRLFFEVHEKDMCLGNRKHAHKMCARRMHRWDHIHDGCAHEDGLHLNDGSCRVPENERQHLSARPKCNEGEDVTKCYNEGEDVTKCYWDILENNKEKKGYVCFWDTDRSMESCLENMIDWFLKRSFLEQANETGFNVYTSANAYFYACRNAEEKARIDKANDAQAEANKEAKQKTIRAKNLEEEVKDDDVPNPVHGGGISEDFPEQETKTNRSRLLDSRKDKKSYKATAEERPAISSQSTTEEEKACHLGVKGCKLDDKQVELQVLATRWEKGFLKYIKESFFVTIFWGFPEYDAADDDALKKRKLDISRAEVQSSVERALICFILQGGLYFGSLWLSQDKVCYEDSGVIGVIFKNIMSVVIIFFAFQYLVTISISEFYINTLSFIQETKDWLQKTLMCLNILINSLFTLSMVYSTAVILKSSESFMDLAMNSVAIFFISELDDMMISEIDEYSLNARAVQSLIFYMRDLSTKTDIGHTSEHLAMESHLTRLFSLGAFLGLLPFSYYVFFTGSGATDC